MCGITKGFIFRFAAAAQNCPVSIKKDCVPLMKYQWAHKQHN